MLEPNRNILGGVKPSDPLGIYFSPKTLLILIVVVILLCLSFYLCGVYYGRKDAFDEMAKASAMRAKSYLKETTSSGSVPLGSQQNETQTNKITSFPTPTSTSNRESGESVQSEDAKGTTVIQTEVPQETSPEVVGDKGKENIQNTNEDSTSRKTFPTETHALSPITPPLEQIQDTPERSAIQLTEKEVQGNPKNAVSLPKGKTYTIQLVSLSGVDAENRLKTLMDRVKRKYGNKYQFLVERVGKFYRLSAINFPDEKSAREALKELIQEKDFSKAILKKP